jgi:integrase
VREIDPIPGLREELLADRAAVGTLNLDGPVLPTRDGAHRTNDNRIATSSGPCPSRQRRAARARDAAATGRRQSHKFRRIYVALMLEAGAPLTDVQDQVGQEDIKTTHGIYARSFAASSAPRSAALDKLSCTAHASSLPHRRCDALKRRRSVDAVAVRGVRGLERCM